jgi:hypothetical protein
MSELRRLIFDAFGVKLRRLCAGFMEMTSLL